MAYDQPRPNMSADIRRQVVTHAGHQCSINRCNSNTFDIHHIDGNRENNSINNLIALCPTHHRLAHEGKISRQDLRKYKSDLSNIEDVNISNRQSYTYSDHDMALLKRIEDFVPYNLILAIRNEGFGSKVNRKIIEPFHIIEENANDPLFSFQNQELENIRLHIVHKVEEFQELFTAHSAGGVDGYYDYININDFLRYSKNKEADRSYFLLRIQETSTLANQFCDLILQLRAKKMQAS